MVTAESQSEARAECIKVLVRIRPPIGPAETSSKDVSQLHVDGNALLVRGKSWGNKAASSADYHSFKFDHIASTESTQEDVFQTV
jgi:hypothetical protein